MDEVEDKEKQRKRNVSGAIVARIFSQTRRIMTQQSHEGEQNLIINSNDGHMSPTQRLYAIPFVLRVTAIPVSNSRSKSSCFRPIGPYSDNQGIRLRKGLLNACSALARSGQHPSSCIRTRISAGMPCLLFDQHLEIRAIGMHQDPAVLTVCLWNGLPIPVVRTPQL